VSIGVPLAIESIAQAAVSGTRLFSSSFALQKFSAHFS
jgi:hypothetical protein